MTPPPGALLSVAIEAVTIAGSASTIAVAAGVVEELLALVAWTYEEVAS